MSMVGFPLLLIPLAIYNMIAFLMPGVGFGEAIVRLRLVSGETWTVSLGDALLALGVLLLWLEVIKAARPNGKYLTDHLLSLLVAAGAAAEFVMWPKFGNSTFFLLALLAMVDFFAGIGLRAKRRRMAMTVAGPAAPAARATPATEAPEPEPADAEPVRDSVTHLPVEPSVEPVQAPASEPVPAAVVAESVLLERPDPRAVASNAAEQARQVNASDEADPPAVAEEPKDLGHAPNAPKP